MSKIEKSGPDIVREGAALAAKALDIDQLEVNETLPGWKSRDIAKMEMNSGVEGEQLELLGEARDMIASELHEEWRKTRLLDDGNYDPRVKKTKDEEWIAVHGGVDEVDIANTPYVDLPADWQAENKAAAEVVVGILVGRNGEVDLNDTEVRNATGSAIHSAWLERNSWATGGELDVPFDDLPEVEKSKDIDQVRVALGVFNPVPQV